MFVRMVFSKYPRAPALQFQIVTLLLLQIIFLYDCKLAKSQRTRDSSTRMTAQLYEYEI